MRVAHVITRMIVGGAQENTLFNCLDLQDNFGDEVLLITGPSLGPEGDLITNLSSDTRLAVAPVDCLRREIHPYRDWQAYSKVRKIIAEFKPEVVHTHSAKAGVIGRAAAWSLGVPAIVHTVHGAPFHRFQSGVSRALFRFAERWAAKRCHHLISVADAMTDLLVESGVAPAEKFTTVYSGMNVEPFLKSSKFRMSVRKKYGFSDEHIVIGKIARLFHLKGHDDVVDAAVKVIQDHPNVRFFFVGDGILKDQLEKKIASLGLQDYFVFTGLVKPSEVPELISAMDMLVHASYREGLARALPQALISGVPAISYDVDGAKEVVLEGETGYLVAPGNISELSLAVEKLVVNSQSRMEFGSYGRERFTQQFKHQEMTKRIRMLYQELLE
ncbi:MAG: glycosyltransferase family 4 protein [Planctomycetota bacterium]|nr:glycosyltransferase family 4 protein [Planctomycetota bacterium]